MTTMAGEICSVFPPLLAVRVNHAARAHAARSAALAKHMPVERTWLEAGVRCTLYTSGIIRYGHNIGWPSKLRRTTSCSKAAPTPERAVREHGDFAACAAYAARAHVGSDDVSSESSGSDEGDAPADAADEQPSGLG